MIGNTPRYAAAYDEIADHQVRGELAAEIDSHLATIRNLKTAERRAEYYKDRAEELRVRAVSDAGLIATLSAENRRLLALLRSLGVEK